MNMKSSNFDRDRLKAVRARERIEEIFAYGRSIWAQPKIQKSKKLYNRKRDRKVSFDVFIHHYRSMKTLESILDTSVEDVHSQSMAIEMYSMLADEIAKSQCKNRDEVLEAIQKAWKYDGKTKTLYITETAWCRSRLERPGFQALDKKIWKFIDRIVYGGTERSVIRTHWVYNTAWVGGKNAPKVIELTRAGDYQPWSVCTNVGLANMKFIAPATENVADFEAKAQFMFDFKGKKPIKDIEIDAGIVWINILDKPAESLMKDIASINYKNVRRLLINISCSTVYYQAWDEWLQNECKEWMKNIKGVKTLVFHTHRNGRDFYEELN